MKRVGTRAESLPQRFSWAPQPSRSETRAKANTRPPKERNTIASPCSCPTRRTRRRSRTPCSRTPGASRRAVPARGGSPTTARHVDAVQGDGESRSRSQVPGAPTASSSTEQPVRARAARSRRSSSSPAKTERFSAWNPKFNPNAPVVFSDPGSVYKGLAIHGDVLYSTDFAECKVETFQGDFFDGNFEDSTPPANSRTQHPRRLLSLRHPGHRRIGLRDLRQEEGVDDVAGRATASCASSTPTATWSRRSGSRGC